MAPSFHGPGQLSRPCLGGVCDAQAAEPAEAPALRRAVLRVAGHGAKCREARGATVHGLVGNGRALEVDRHLSLDKNQLRSVRNR